MEDAEDKKGTKPSSQAEGFDENVKIFRTYRRCVLCILTPRVSDGSIVSTAVKRQIKCTIQ